MRWVGRAALLGVALGSCGPQAYTCVDDAECTRAPEGQCEPGGGCSYPADDCDSGRRFSPYSPVDPGQCVDDGETTGPIGSDSGMTGDITGEDSMSVGDASSGDGPATCDLVDCSGQGECVELDGEATCDCAVGYYDVDGECLEDPCLVATCFFADAIDGNDQGAGTRDDPWQTLDRLNDAIQRAQPGDHFLLKRGGVFSGPELRVVGVSGDPGEPIVVGAYGPVAEPRPDIELSAVLVSAAAHVEIRDLTVHDEPGVQTPNRPCVRVQESEHVTIRDIEAYDCHRRGIRVQVGSSYTALVGNHVHDVDVKAGIFVSDTSWAEPVVYIGSHHWIAGNLIEGVEENGIDVQAADGVGDVKIVDNTVADAASRGIIANDTAAVWIAGNTIVGVGPADGGRGLQATGGWAHVQANVVVDAFEGMNVTSSGSVSRNTVMVGAANYGMRIAGGSKQVHDNLIAALDARWLFVDTDLPGDWLETMDGNVYATLGAADCVMHVPGEDLDFAAWQRTFGYDAAGACGIVPGLELPSAAAPDPGWPGCDTVGAVDCTGQLRPYALPPSDGLDDDDGLGWEGPTVIRQRYPLP